MKRLPERKRNGTEPGSLKEEKDRFRSPIPSLDTNIIARYSFTPLTGLGFFPFRSATEVIILNCERILKSIQSVAVIAFVVFAVLAPDQLPVRFEADASGSFKFDDPV